MLEIRQYFRDISRASHRSLLAEVRPHGVPDLVGKDGVEVFESRAAKALIAAVERLEGDDERLPVEVQSEEVKYVLEAAVDPIPL